MKKILFLVMTLAVMVSGCGGNIQTNSASNSKVQSIAQNLAKASANNDKDKMVQYGNELIQENAIPKEIVVKQGCHEAFYSYMGKEYSEKYCK